MSWAPTRRAVFGGLAAGVASGALGASVLRFGPATPFSFDLLKARTRRLAMTPWRAPPAPTGLQALDFDSIGAVHFRPEDALWKGAPGFAPVEFFHLGRYARTPVTINVVEGARARPVLYSNALFDIPAGNPAAGLADTLGFAGFRVLNTDAPGDWLAFQGASYFRAATPFNQYGLSARAIAIDTASGTPEEFPVFTDFWLGHDDAGNLVVHALLDGPSVAGAFRFVHHGTSKGLTQDVEAALSFRRSVSRLGLAPLTSMYWYGRTDRGRAADWRPQIHDSDGLSMWTGAGERIWRPLDNPPRVIVNAFQDKGPRGFGLMQRDRDFPDYQDDGAFYDRRPSLWVEPAGAWGPGAVELVEIPTDSETDDNIVAFWRPARPPTAGETVPLAYRLFWCDEEPAPVGVAKVVATWSGQAGRPGQAATAGARKFVIDFSGGRLGDLNRASGVRPVVSLSRGEPLSLAAYPVVGTDRWRLMVDAPIPSGNTLDLRAFLRLNGEALTETWVGQAFG